MLSVHRFAVADADTAEALRARLRAAVDVLAGRPGFVRAHIGRAVDDPAEWLLVTEWTGVGPYRRALSSYDAKLHAHPVLAEARHEVSGYEVLDAVTPGEPDKS